MTYEKKLSRRARYTLLLFDVKDPPNEAETAALWACIHALDKDLTRRAASHLEHAQVDP